MKSPTSSKGKNMLNTVADRNKSVENDCEKEMRFKSRKTGFINIYKSIKKQRAEIESVENQIKNKY